MFQMVSLLVKNALQPADLLRLVHYVYCGLTEFELDVIQVEDVILVSTMTFLETTETDV
jgi:hypothetical protein